MPAKKSIASFPCVTCGKPVVGWSGYCVGCKLRGRVKTVRTTMKRFRRLLPVGVRIGRLEVSGWPFHKVARSGRLEWYIPVLCACGVRKEVLCNNLLKPGHCRSCGCLFRQLAARRRSTHGATNTPLYGVWTNMLTRCYNPKTDRYSRYGGRGIVVCEEWRTNFAAFLRWAEVNGWRQGLQIDRIDNDGPYSPGNCRFVTRAENGRNKSSNHRVTAFGETKPVSEWVEDPRCVATWATLRGRLRRGWDAEAALTTPLIRKRR